MKVDTMERHALRVGAVHHVGPYNTIGVAFDKLGTIIGPRIDVFQHADAGMVGIYHDDPQVTPEAELQSEAGVILPPGVSVPGLAEQTIPAGRYARTVHVGAYDKLPETWAKIMGEWMESSGNRLGDGATYELYKNDPRNTPEPELITEVWVSIV